MNEIARLSIDVVDSNEMQNIIDLTLFLVKTLSRPVRYAITSREYIVDNMKTILAIGGRMDRAEKYIVRMEEMEPVTLIDITMIISESMRDRSRLNLDIG
jgi:hypothetical protein